MTDFEHSTLLASHQTCPNESFDSAIDSISETCFCDDLMPSPTAMNQLSSIIFLSSYDCHRSGDWNNRSIVNQKYRNIKTSNDSKASYTRLINRKSPAFTCQCKEPQKCSGNHKQHEAESSTEPKIEMVTLSNRIDASSSVLSCGRHTSQPTGSSGRRGVSSSHNLVCLNEPSKSSGQYDRKFPSQQHQQHHHQQQVSYISSPPTTSSPLRSSRSFTTSYRQRPNVTLIRRKSASERLAESKSKYIRDKHIDSDANVTNSVSRGVAHDDHCNLTKDTMKFLRVTPTSTKSSHSSSTPLSGLSPTFDNIKELDKCDDKCSNSQNGQNNLVDKINNQLNKTKQLKKRASPKLSDGSAVNSTSNLEIQLRELISVDNTGDHLLHPNDNRKESNQSKSVDEVFESNVDEVILQKQKEANDIYRAELKYICSSSSSSLSTCDSEPNPVSKQQESNLSEKILNCTAAPSVEQSCTQNRICTSSVCRSKSDSFSNSATKERFRQDRINEIERLFIGLPFDSERFQVRDDLNGRDRHKSSQHSSKIRHYTNSSISNDSLDGINKYKKWNHSYRDILEGYNVSSTPKSSSTNDLSSINSSHLSTSNRFCENSLNHSKSISKLTFENLMLHQQNLASSRSCTNLVVNFQNGPSVVERNARIIKWLFNCRKAMNQSVDRN